MPLVFKNDFGHMGLADGWDETQSGSQTFDHFIEQLMQYIINNLSNVYLKVILRLWFIGVDQWLYISPL